MKSRLFKLSIAAVTLAFVMPSLSSAATLRTVQSPVRGQYIVVLKSSAATLDGERGSALRVRDVAGDFSRRHRVRLLRSFRKVLRGFVVNADERGLARLLADPRVEYVQQDGISSVSATQTGATWGLDRIDQRNLPLSGSYTYDRVASGVHAYIVDTGVMLSHSEFSGRMGNGYDVVTPGGDASDCNGHGTHVAGTVGGGTWGVAKGVTIHPVRVLACNGYGDDSGIIAGLDWIAANHVKPAVANISINSDFVVQPFDDAVNRLVATGVTVVVSAGNYNSDACRHTPASAAGAIVVGSTTNTDTRVSNSNYGACLDLFAPGGNIVSAWHTGPNATQVMTGTSMAAPHVAGVAALYLAANPAAPPAVVATAITNAATSGKVIDARSGSPNRLLYSILADVSTYSISGTITNSAGTGIAGVTVSYGMVSATTSNTGAYTLGGLTNGTYTLTPSLSGYTFSPASRSVTVNSANVTGQNFTATAANVAPVANFSVSTSALTATFTDTSRDSDGSIVSRSWNFGDGTTSTIANPTKTYAASGTYNATLTVTDNGGLTHSKTSAVTVSNGANVAPVANFSSSVSGLTATFTDLSSDSDGSIASRSWNFGDGTTSNATNPSRTYAASGTYNVTLTVTDNGGLTHSRTSAITVSSSANAAPTARFNWNRDPNIVGAALIKFDGSTSFDSDGHVVSYRWDFGDGTSSTAAVPYKVYRPGAYRVSLTVTDNLGKTATAMSAADINVSQSTPILLTREVEIVLPTASANQWSPVMYYSVPSNSNDTLDVLMRGLAPAAPNADLYVRVNNTATATVSVETFNSLVCAPYLSGSNEGCKWPNPSSGNRYYVTVHARGQAYSNVTVQAMYKVN